MEQQIQDMAKNSKADVTALDDLHEFFFFLLLLYPPAKRRVILILVQISKLALVLTSLSHFLYAQYHVNKWLDSL